MTSLIGSAKIDENTALGDLMQEGELGIHSILCSTAAEGALNTCNGAEHGGGD